MKISTSLLAGVALGALAATTAGAQTKSAPLQQQATQPIDRGGQNAAARTCTKDLASFDAQMRQDDFWVSGWGSRYATPMATPPTAPGGPWGSNTPFGMNSPRYQVYALHAAAAVLARRGDEAACSHVVAEMRELYDGYVADLRKAGVKPSDIASWRQQRLVAARPVEELDRRLGFDDITGTDIRNVKDEQLGTIDNVIFDPKTGRIAYAVVARGGVLGFGEDHVVVPWQSLRATRDLNAFVLNVDEQTMTNAPKVDPDRIGDSALFQQQRQQADQYWQQHVPS
ncbi:MAG: PRC-barrel domain-containing protein [Enhydrobacter sp.]|nr:PRC-barrel domain-containing protein [Enhydrobacter sp.]